MLLNVYTCLFCFWGLPVLTGRKNKKTDKNKIKAEAVYGSKSAARDY
jgi:hypothetical protein